MHNRGMGETNSRTRAKPAGLRRLAAVATLLAATPLAAQAPRHGLYETWTFSLSTTAVILNSNIRVDGETRGTDLDAEDDLGLETTKIQPRGAVRWRPGRRHELELGYQMARRTGTKVLERDIEFGDTTFNVGADLTTTYDTDLAFLTYRFAFTAKERTQFGAALGFGALLLDVGLDAEAPGGEEASTSKGVTAPTASLGVYGRFLSGDRWYFETDARVLKLSIDRFDARVIEAGGAARYALSDRWSLEGGYSLSAIKVDIGPKSTDAGEEGIASGQIKFSLQSVRLGVVFVP